MTLPVTDRDASLRALEETSSRYASTLRSVTDPSRTAIGQWSIAETAAHMSHLFGLFAELMSGGHSFVRDHLSLDNAWNKKVAEDPERDPDVLAGRVETATAQFIERATQEAWEQPQNWHGDIKLPTFTLGSLLINEAAIHGLDIASAEDRPWDIAPDHARIVITGIMPVLPHFVDKEKAAGLRATYELSVRGPGGGFLTFNNGNLDVSSTSPGKVDCHISADPVAYLLIGYGRIPQTPALLKGKVLSWGRKPWLGLRFPKLFHSV